MSSDRPRRSRGEPRPISIWSPRLKDGELVFARPSPGPFGDHYADRPLIPARCRRRRRLCLFGESAAAGYLLSPHVTPAKALQELLGADDWDVVDLARTNERIATLAETVEAAEQLEPDLRVVWAGNNWRLLETVEWSPYFPDGEARRRFGEALADGGVLGPSRRAESELRGRVESLFQRLAALPGRTLVLVPEVNLADWRSRQPVPWLSGTGIASWHRSVSQAERSIAEGDPSRAALSARDALALDRGLCPTAAGLLGAARLALGRRSEATEAFRSEVAAARPAASVFLSAPLCAPAIQDLVTELCQRHGFECVDQRRLLAEAGDGAPPGRRFFYDYCHLTPEGVRVTVEAIATTVLDLGLGGAWVGAKERKESELPRTAAAARSRIGSRRPALLPEQKAIAEIGAALHGAHRGARGEIVRYWLRRAVERWPGAEELLLEMVESRATGLPVVLTRAQLRDPFPTPQQGSDWPFLDAEVIAAVAAIAGAPAVRARLERAAPAGRIELWHPLERPFPEVLPEETALPSAVTSAFWPTTDLAAVAPGGRDRGEIELVLRCPGARARRVVGVSWNGRSLARFSVGREWQRLRVAVDVPRTPALGWLSLHWPVPQRSGEAALEAAVQRLRAGRPAHLAPVFGELLSAEWRDR